MNAVVTIASLTWLRLRRGRTIWITALLFALPLAVAVLAALRIEDPSSRWTHVADLTLRSLVLLAPVIHLAPALSEELDAQTYTFLWSRPIPRPALLFGKMLVVTPALVVLSCLAILAGWLMSSADASRLGPALAAAATGTVATSAVSVGIGTLFPRAPLAVAIGWVLIFEQVFPAIPTLQHLSTLFHTEVIAGLPHSFILAADTSSGTSLVFLAVLTALWLWLAVWKIRR